MGVPSFSNEKYALVDKNKRNVSKQATKNQFLFKNDLFQCFMWKLRVAKRPARPRQTPRIAFSLKWSANNHRNYFLAKDKSILERNGKDLGSEKCTEMQQPQEIQNKPRTRKRRKL